MKMNIDYESWPRAKLIVEIRMLREGIHRLATKAQADRIRLARIERTRQFFNEVGEHLLEDARNAGGL